jgi:hypothetical protein
VAIVNVFSVVNVPINAIKWMMLNVKSKHTGVSLEQRISNGRLASKSNKRSQIENAGISRDAWRLIRSFLSHVTAVNRRTGIGNHAWLLWPEQHFNGNRLAFVGTAKMGGPTSLLRTLEAQRPKMELIKIQDGIIIIIDTLNLNPEENEESPGWLPSTMASTISNHQSPLGPFSVCTSHHEENAQ